MPLTRRTFLAAAFAGAVLGPRALAQEPGSFAILKTPLGALRGRADSGGARSFLGVPFAEPPVGPLRFRPPQPARPWTGVRDALALAPEPVQSGDAPMSEDCLYLNVWTPSTPGPHPVMVWIYGGGNSSGSTRDPMYDGASFARSGVVLVTAAYRVGALGFLELGAVLGPSYAGSGNNGLRDQIAALQWVRSNIEAFGGDPGRVTVFGQSAGAKDIAALLAAPSAKGLFQQAILESGGGSTVHTEDSARDVAGRLLTAFYAPEFRQPAPSALLTMPAAALIAAQEKMTRHYYAFPFRAVTGGEFLPNAPLALITGGASKNISLIVGTNRDESRFFFPASRAEQPIEDREVANISVPQIDQQRARYEAAFPAWSALKTRTRLLTAEEYWIPSVRLAAAHAAAGGETRMYRFELASDLPQYRKYDGYAVHTSELPFVWSHLPAEAAAADHQLAASMHGAWSAFAAAGSPAAPGLPLWPAYDSAARETLVIDSRGRPSIVSDPAGDERRLWDGIL